MYQHYHFTYLILVYSPINPKYKVVNFELRDLIRIWQDGKQPYIVWEGTGPKMGSSVEGGTLNCPQRVESGFTEVIAF